MARYILTTPATNDLREILQYIRKRSPKSAKVVRTEFRTAMQRLAAFPRIGHVREDVADESLRFWSVYSYLIAYRPELKPIEIVRVLHGARDIGKFFKGK